MTWFQEQPSEQLTWFLSRIPHLKQMRHCILDRASTPTVAKQVQSDTVLRLALHQGSPSRIDGG